MLSVGEPFDSTEFNMAAVLEHHGKVLKSSIPGIPVDEVEAALRDCKGQTECDVRLRESPSSRCRWTRLRSARVTFCGACRVWRPQVAPCRGFLRTSSASPLWGLCWPLPW